MCGKAFRVLLLFLWVFTVAGCVAKTQNSSSPPLQTDTQRQTVDNETELDGKETYLEKKTEKKAAKKAESIPYADPHAVLIKFMEAFNQRDSAVMTSLLAEDVKWISIIGDETKIEIPNRTELENYLNKYFAVLPTVSSRVDASIVSGAFISFKETVSWTVKDVDKTQSSLGVYEVREGKIVRVWYYPE